MLPLSLSQQARLAAAAHPFVQEIAESTLHELLTDLSAAYEAFVDSRMDAEGRIRVGESLGGLLLPPSDGKLVPASEVEPWECAGPDVHSEIDLAFKLWLDDQFQPFVGVIHKYGIAATFAVITRLDCERASIDALIRANELLVACLMGDRMTYRKHADSRTKSNAALPTARKNSATSRTTNAKERDARLHQMARDYWANHLANGIPEVVRYFRNKGLFPELTDGGIARKLKGVKRRALIAVSTK